MIGFKQWMENKVYRLDPNRVNNYTLGLKTYAHNDDWTSSKVADNTNDLKNRSTGLFAGKLKDIIPYAIPRNVPWVLAHIPNRPSLYIQKTDYPQVRGSRPWLSAMDSSSFEEVPSGEYFSKRLGSPIRQDRVRNAIQFIKKWMDIWTVDDLDNVIRDLKDRNIPFSTEGIQ